MHGILYLLYHQTVCVFLSIQKYILKEILIPEQPIITFDLIFNDIVRIRLHEYVIVSFLSKPQTFLCVFTLHLHENDQKRLSFSLN